MKKINSLLWILMSLFMLTWTACDDSDFTPGENFSGEGVYISPAVATAIDLEGEEGTFDIEILRSKIQGAVASEVKVEFGEGAANCFTVPSVVNFAEGENSAKLSVAYSNVVRGTKYQMTITVADGTPYGLSSQTFTLCYPEDKGNWEVVSTKAVLIDNLFSMYGAKNVQISELTVEKEVGVDRYRIRSPYDNSYFQALFQMNNVIGDDSDLPYIILDGEKFKEEAPGKYYIAPTNLAFQMVDGVGPKGDREWNTFGSVAGNLNTPSGPIPPTSEEYPLASYDKNSKSFDFGAVYHNVGGEKGGMIPFTDMKLYLDPALMVPDYDRDYTWYDDYLMSGTFKSTLDGEQSWKQAVQRAKEDPTFFRFVSLYAPSTEEQKTHIYFHLDLENKVFSFLKNQPTGLKTQIGNKDIYVTATTGKTAIDAEKKLLSFGLKFHLLDEKGKEAGVLAEEVMESFTYGNAYALAKGKKMDDYVGNWDVVLTNGTQNIPSKVSINKVQDEQKVDHLKVTGLSGIDPKKYNDEFELYFDSESGWLGFGFQQLKKYQDKLDTFIAPFASDEFALDSSGEVVLLGGFNENGLLEFVNVLTNPITYDSMVYLVSPDGKEIGLLSGLWNALTWKKTVEARSFHPASVNFTQGNVSKANESNRLYNRADYATFQLDEPKPVKISRTADITVNNSWSIIR